MKTATRDIQLSEIGTGGDFSVANGDLVMSETLFQTIYLALFGGNIEASTQGNEIESEQRFDYWANDLLFGSSSSKQFNSQTERTIANTVLNSSGRIAIQQAVEADLDFLSQVVNVEVNVLIKTTNRLEIQIRLTRLDNQQVKQYALVVDNATGEVITRVEI